MGRCARARGHWCRGSWAMGRRKRAAAAAAAAVIICRGQWRCLEMCRGWGRCWRMRQRPRQWQCFLRALPWLLVRGVAGRGTRQGLQWQQWQGQGQQRRLLAPRPGLVGQPGRRPLLQGLGWPPRQLFWRARLQPMSQRATLRQWPFAWPRCPRPRRQTLMMRAALQEAQRAPPARPQGMARPHKNIVRPLFERKKKVYLPLLVFPTARACARASRTPPRWGWRLLAPPPQVAHSALRASLPGSSASS